MYPYNHIESQWWLLVPHGSPHSLYNAAFGLVLVVFNIAKLSQSSSLSWAKLALFPPNHPHPHPCGKVFSQLQLTKYV